MSFLERLFGTKEESVQQPDIRFGRYSDSYKDASNYDAWDEALEKFEGQQYVDCFKAFFNYLRDEEEDNVRWWGEKVVSSLFYQGFKKDSGFAMRNLRRKPYAQTEQLNVGFLRRLLEKNFSMNFGRFALGDNNELLVVFDTYSLDGSPYKLYFALKEMAIQADKFDDLLLDEFDMLKPVEVSHLIAIPDEVKEVKYKFIDEIQVFSKEIKEARWIRAVHGGIRIRYLLLDQISDSLPCQKPEGIHDGSPETHESPLFCQG